MLPVGGDAHRAAEIVEPFVPAIGRRDEPAARQHLPRHGEPLSGVGGEDGAEERLGKEADHIVALFGQIMAFIPLVEIVGRVAAAPAEIVERDAAFGGVAQHGEIAGLACAGDEFVDIVPGLVPREDFGAGAFLRRAIGEFGAAMGAPVAAAPVRKFDELFVHREMAFEMHLQRRAAAFGDVEEYP